MVCMRWSSQNYQRQILVDTNKNHMASSTGESDSTFSKNKCILIMDVESTIHLLV